MIAGIRYALRQVVKSPGFSFTSIGTLALGIGTCTAMFSIIYAVLLKPLPVREPSRLVWIENVLGNDLSGRTSRADTITGWRAQNKSFESIAAYFAFSDYTPQIMTVDGKAERLRAVGVSDNFLTTLGVNPIHGRNFTADECRWQGPGAVLLSHGYWLRRFGGDPNVIGRKLTINQQPATVVGVLPASFDVESIFSPGSAVDALTPFPLCPETSNWGNTVFGIGRLKPGATLEQAEADLTVISNQQHELLKGYGSFGAYSRPLDEALRGRFRQAFFILAGAVACVLAVACVNLSNLLLARVNVRRQEFAVRTALGASRWHLIRQALIESLVLAFLGAALGVPLAVFATDALARLQTFGVPLLHDASVNPTALAVTIGLTAVAGIACGLFPALHLSAHQRGQALQQATQQRSAGRSAVFARNFLVVAEVALACMLLVGAGLLFRSFSAVLQVNLGFQPQHAMSWRIDPQRNFKAGADVDRYLGSIAEAVAALPGVETAGFSDTLPLGRNRTWGAGAVGVEYGKDAYPTALPRLIDPHYLQAMRIPLLAGRYFDEHFDPKAAKAVIINESLARTLWPGRNALGEKIRVNGESTVIGVVANVRHRSLEDSGGNEMYLDCRQCGDWSTLELVVRSNRPAASLVPDVRAALAAIDPALPSSDYYELDALIDNAVAPRRLITKLLGFFSALTLTLAALGLYGVIAYSVAQRTQEIGIRMAIGAQRRDVLDLILRGGLKLVAIGVILGLVGAFLLSRVLQGLLFGVTAHDPVVFAVNAALLFAVATAACLLPALRATRIDPMVALRTD